MSSVNPIFSYTARDYEGSRKEGLARIPILTNGMWTDLNASSPGVILLDYMHALLDMCNYYLDHQALESFISTSKERKNLIRLAQSYAYAMRAAQGSRVDVSMYLKENTVFNTRVIVPKNTPLSSNTGIPYLTLEDAIISTTQVSTVVPCVQGELVEESYTGTGVSSSTSTNIDTLLEYTDQVHALSGQGIDIDTINIVDNSGNTWERVDLIAFCEDASRVFQVLVDEENGVSLRFGNGVRGYSPKTSDVLTISYVLTLGNDGKILSNNLSGVLNGTDSNQASIEVTYYNPDPSSGGSYGETDEDLRINIRSSLKTLGRAVTREDFDKLVSTIDGVRDYKVYDIRSNPEDCLYHQVKILILPDEGAATNTSLIKSVRDYLQEKSIPPTNVLVSMPTLKLVNINLSIKSIPPKIGEESTYSQVSARVLQYFSEEVFIGEDFNPYALIAYIQSLGCVKVVTSITPPSTISVLPTEVASLGTLVIDIL
jgi:hypothetical protein